MESIKSRNQAAVASVIVSIAVFILKFWAYRETHSSAVFSDALESIVNVIAAGITLFAIRFASQPADSGHPYGHGKAEYFSSAFEGGLIFFAALTIAYEAVNAFFNSKELHQLEFGLVIVAAAAVINLLLGLYLGQISKKYNSEALKASSMHVLSDVWTSGGVLIGLFLVMMTGQLWLDAVVAILLAIQLAYSGYKIVMRAVSGLIDAQDESSVGKLVEAFNKNRISGIIDIHHVRILRSGSFHHVDAHVVVPEFWNVANAHEQIELFERHVVSDYYADGELAFHLDPCQCAYCENCDVSPCPIRRAEFKKLKKFEIDQLIAGPNI